MPFIFNKCSNASGLIKGLSTEDAKVVHASQNPLSRGISLLGSVSSALHKGRAGGCTMEIRPRMKHLQMAVAIEGTKDSLIKSSLPLIKIQERLPRNLYCILKTNHNNYSRLPRAG